MIILENICTAPWNDDKLNDSRKNGSRGINFYMSQAGYFCRPAILDTKDYYLPQTRNRGYMICVKKSWFDPGQDIAQSLNAWAKLVKRLERPASVPIDAMLLSEDNYGYGQVSDPADKERDWAKCKEGHVRYRADNGLGMKHELTKWSTGGSSTLPDYMDRKMRFMVPRILDTLDIAHLRNIKRGFDDRYYR